MEVLNKLSTVYSHRLVRISSKLTCSWVELRNKLIVCLHKAIRRQTKLPFSLWCLPTSVVLNCQTLLSPFSASLYKDEELVDLTVSSCWPFPFPGIPTPEDQANENTPIISFSACPKTVLYFSDSLKYSEELLLKKKDKDRYQKSTRCRPLEVSLWWKACW